MNKETPSIKTSECCMSTEILPRLQCMNIWGGNQSTNTGFTTAGLDILVYSCPYQNAHAGGDIYQISSCSSGSITRLLLADVSGHGEKVAEIAVKLRSILHKHISEINQKHVVKAINKEFSNWEGSEAFATAVIGTFFAPTGNFSLCNAGHPTPLIFRMNEKRWDYLLNLNAEEKRNLPIGILPEQSFSGFDVPMSKGDMILLYTDAFPESQNEHGEQIKEQGLLEIMNSLGNHPPMLLMEKLKDHLQGLNSHNLQTDDCTLILIQANGSSPRMQDLAAAPFRMVKDLLGFSNIK